MAAVGVMLEAAGDGDSGHLLHVSVLNFGISSFFFNDFCKVKAFILGHTNTHTSPRARLPQSTFGAGPSYSFATD